MHALLLKYIDEFFMKYAGNLSVRKLENERPLLISSQDESN